jgi:hypothetical protein
VQGITEKRYTLFLQFLSEFACDNRDVRHAGAPWVLGKVTQGRAISQSRATALANRVADAAASMSPSPSTVPAMPGSPRMSVDVEKRFAVHES